MKIIRKSIISGKIHEREIDVDPEKLARWERGEGDLIQREFPNLTPEEREFIQTGSTPEEWETLKEPE